LERHAEVKIPPEEYPSVYISIGIEDPAYAILYNLCGNPLRGFGEKSLCLSTTSCNHTFRGPQLEKLYQDGVFEVHSTGILTDNLYHSQTTTMIPIEIFMKMDFTGNVKNE
jgi:hypothetical protein